MPFFFKLDFVWRSETVQCETHTKRGEIRRGLNNHSTTDAWDVPFEIFYKYCKQIAVCFRLKMLSIKNDIYSITEINAKNAKKCGTVLMMFWLYWCTVGWAMVEVKRISLNATLILLHSSTNLASHFFFSYSGLILHVPGFLLLQFFATAYVSPTLASVFLHKLLGIF